MYTELINFKNKMKVKDAIVLLKKLDQEAELITISDNFELKGSKISVTSINQYKSGSKRIETFTDAFDNEDYEKTVWSIIGGKITVVKIS